MTTPKAINQKVEVSHEDILWIKTKLNDMDIMLHKLNTTVIGDIAYGQKGLVQKVMEHSDYIAKDEKFKSKIIGGGIVLGSVWAALIKFWDKIFA
jgi:hypothetical protein